MAMMDEDGNVFSLIVYWPKEEIIQTLQDWLENVNVPYIVDDLLEEAVYQGKRIPFIPTEKSINLGVGYSPEAQTWEVIVRYVRNGLDFADVHSFRSPCISAHHPKTHLPSLQ